MRWHGITTVFLLQLCQMAIDRNAYLEEKDKTVIAKLTQYTQVKHINQKTVCAWMMILSVYIARVYHEIKMPSYKTAAAQCYI